MSGALFQQLFVTIEMSRMQFADFWSKFRKILSIIDFFTYYKNICWSDL